MSLGSSPSAVEKACVDNAEPAIEVRNVTVSFRSYEQRPTSLKETLLSAVRKGRLKYYSTFDALSDVSLTVRRGQVFAIIGSNGAGKSTLLRCIAGVLQPTSGEVRVHGNVDSLLALGAGFDADLNAMENIVLNGSLFKRSPEVMRERTPRILEFAELVEFAHTPIKYYSSGMSARLGFSVAVDRDPDILIVDEVLAVGDERFQKKCQGVFQKFLDEGKTIVIVTHSMSQVVNIAHQVAVLAKGKVVYTGDPKTATEVYRDKDYQVRLSQK